MFTITQGTTPTHNFTLPFDGSMVKTARFVYSQDGEVKIVKEGSAVDMTGTKASTTLTQEDTFKLDPNIKVKLVLRVLTKGGDAQATEPVFGRCRISEDREVLA